MWDRGRGTSQSIRSWASGYAKGRSRTHSILQHLVVAHRLRQAGNSYLSIFFDLRNAFWSVKHDLLRSNIDDVALPQDRELLCARVEKFVVHIPASADEDGCDLLSRSGVPPGDSWASELFSLAYNRVLDEFLQNTESD